MIAADPDTLPELSLQEAHLRVDARNRSSTYQFCLLVCFVSWLLLPSLVHAEQLPIKTFTTADGLANDAINQIVRDSRGFLWFCTAEGLSRFDGYQFTNYLPGADQKSAQIEVLLQDRAGTIWLALRSRLQGLLSKLHVARQERRPYLA